MKSSRFSCMLCALISCGLSALSLPVQAQPYGGGDALPPPLIAPGHTVTPNGTPLPDARRRYSSPPPPANISPEVERPSYNPSEDGRSRLRSAYDRASNPAYYNMLDQLERNQKKRKLSPASAAAAKSLYSTPKKRSSSRLKKSKYKKSRASKARISHKARASRTRNFKKAKSTRIQRSSSRAGSKAKIHRKKTYRPAKKNRYRR